MKEGERMNIPVITNFDTALQIYYGCPEIGNKEIVELFGSLSTATISKLKKAVKAEMNSQSILSYRMYKVNTEVAFKTWGIDIDDIEFRKNKLLKLGLYNNGIDG